RNTSVSTKGAANDCRLPVRINEVESSGGEPGDWIELRSVGSSPIDLGGLVVSDSDPTHTYVIPGDTTIAPGGFVVLDEADFGFGLGGEDAVRVSADGVVLDEYSWTAHAATTYGRCPDGTGAFATTTAPTKGAANQCAGILTPSPWPGGQDVVTIDA